MRANTAGRSPARLRVISIARWNELQHYKLRNPTWVKLHADQLDRVDTRALTSCDFGAYCRLLLIASRCGNRIDHDSRWLRRYGVSKVAIRHLHAAGLITISEPLSEPPSTRSESDRAPIGDGSESDRDRIGVTSNTDRDSIEHAGDPQRPRDQAHDSNSASTPLAACMQSACSESDNRGQSTETDARFARENARAHETSLQRAGETQANDDADRRASWTACLSLYPPYSGKQNLIMAESAASTLVASARATWALLEERTRRYAAFCRATGRQVLRPENFFTTAPNPPCLQEWTIPEKPAPKQQSARERITYRPPECEEPQR